MFLTYLPLDILARWWEPTHWQSEPASQLSLLFQRASDIKLRKTEQKKQNTEARNCQFSSTKFVPELQLSCGVLTQQCLFLCLAGLDLPSVSDNALQAFFPGQAPFSNEHIARSHQGLLEIKSPQCQKVGMPPTNSLLLSTLSAFLQPNVSAGIQKLCQKFADMRGSSLN